MEAYRNSPKLFRTVQFPTHYGLSFPTIGVRNPNPKLQSLRSQEEVKLRTSNLACTFTASIRTKAHEKFWRNRSVGVSRDCPNFWDAPLIPGRGKATNFKFYRIIRSVNRKKSQLKISGKVAVVSVRDS